MTKRHVTQSAARDAPPSVELAKMMDGGRVLLACVVCCSMQLHEMDEWGEEGLCRHRCHGSMSLGDGNDEGLST